MKNCLLSCRAVDLQGGCGPGVHMQPTCSATPTTTLHRVGMSSTVLESYQTGYHGWARMNLQQEGKGLKLLNKKIPEINELITFKLCTILSSMMKSCPILPTSSLECKSSLCSVYLCYIHYLPVSHLVAVLVMRLTIFVLQCDCSNNSYFT